MDIFWFVVIGLAILVLYTIIISFVRLSRAKKKKGVFAKYILEQYPDLADVKFLSAFQTERANGLDIALLIDEINQRIVVMTDTPKTGVSSKCYDYKDLESVESKSQVINPRQMFNKVFLYEKAFKLHFANGDSYRMFIDAMTNRDGNDEGKEFVDNILDPWIAQLKAIKTDARLPK